MSRESQKHVVVARLLECCCGFRGTPAQYEAHLKRDLLETTRRVITQGLRAAITREEPL